jgi:nucleotide-binding universal stress UspA family protein
MKKILVPTDLTDSYHNYLKYAISLSIKSNTKLYFYYVSSTKIRIISNLLFKFLEEYTKNLTKTLKIQILNSLSSIHFLTTIR